MNNYFNDSNEAIIAPLLSNISKKNLLWLIDNVMEMYVGQEACLCFS